MGLSASAAAVRSPIGFGVNKRATATITLDHERHILSVPADARGHGDTRYRCAGSILTDSNHADSYFDCLFSKASTMSTAPWLPFAKALAASL